MESGKRKREEDLPSITYLVGDRSFDRLFKEQSLEEIKNVVQRKLQLPSNSTVKLKQLRGGKVIDLDDDDDFAAFSARAKLMRLVDVAVEISQTPAAANGAASSAGAGDALKSSEKSVAKKKRKATNNQPSKDADAPVAPEPKAKKRRTDQPAASIDAPKPTENAQTPKVAPTKGTEKPAPVSAPEAASLKLPAKPTVLINTKTTPAGGEPPKKKSKTAKADTTKDAAEKPPKKTKKTENVKETETPTLPLPNDNAVSAPPGPSEPPKKPPGTKKVATKPPALQSVGGKSSANDTVNGATASEKKKVKSKSKQKGKEVESEAAPSESAPETSASTKGHKKVTIAEASKAPAPKEKKTKQSKPKVKASDTDASQPLNPLDFQGIIDAIARASAHSGGKAKKNTNTEVNSVATSQPSASSAPSVITTTKSGDEAIQNRLEDLRKAGEKEHQLTIKDLESLLKSSGPAASSAKRNAADTTKPSRKHLEADDESEREAAESDEESQPSWTPLVPSNSLLSEVTVESRDEGSSSEEEDEFAQQLEQEEHEPEAGQPSLDDIDLDAIMRGPTPIKLRNLLETMESKEDGSDTEDEGGDIGPLEVEDDSEKERKYRRLSQRLPGSSEEEGDDDEDDGVDDDREQRSPPPKQNTSDALPSSTTSKSSAGPDETLNATDPTESSKDGVQADAFDTDDTRVSVSKAPGSDKDSGKDDGDAPEVLDLDKVSDPSPTRGTTLSHDKADNTNDDPIEPADDPIEFRQVKTSDIDPIEVTTPPTLKATRPLSPVAQSTPKPGVAKRMKNRRGQVPSPSQFPVRAGGPDVDGPQRAGAEEIKRKKKVAAKATREDLLSLSSQPVKRSGTSADLNGHSATPSHSQPLPRHPPSLTQWAAIREPSPSVMMDELDSSNSPIGQGGILGELAGKASDRNVVGEHSGDDSPANASEPLFNLTASQIPFPYSQYNAPVQKRVEVVSDSESEADAGSVKKSTTTNAKTRKLYRTLTDIASQGTLFSQSTPVAPGPRPMASRKGRQADDDDDDESSSSESDDEGQSHIPEAKRAGKLRSKKPKGLLTSLN